MQFLSGVSDSCDAWSLHEVPLEVFGMLFQKCCQECLPEATPGGCRANSFAVELEGCGFCGNEIAVKRCYGFFNRQGIGQFARQLDLRQFGDGFEEIIRCLLEGFDSLVDLFP